MTFRSPCKPALPPTPPGFQPQIDYLDHGAGARQAVASFPGLRLEDLPGQEGWAVEKLANLERLPARGFTVISLPVKVHRGSGGWARPIALVEE